MLNGIELRADFYYGLYYRLQYTDKAVNSARAARKKRWICFFIILVVLIIIAIVVAVVVKNQSK